MYHIRRTPRFRNLNLLWREVSKDKLPWWLNGKQSAYQCRRHGFSPWSGKIPWRRKWQPIPVFLPGEPHGQSSSMCYGLWSQSQTWFSDWKTIRKDTRERYHFPHTVSNFPSIPAGGSIAVFQGFDYASILEIIAWNKRAVITSVCKMLETQEFHRAYLSINFCVYWHIFVFGSTVWHVEVPWPGIKRLPPAVETWSLNHWTTGEVLYWHIFVSEICLKFSLES